MAVIKSAFISLLLFVVFVTACHAADSWSIYTVELTGVVDPSTAMYIERALTEARKANAEAIIIIMDTPGGLVSSAREIVADIFRSRVPVVVYVSPSAAQATSAGALISLSANIIAMAPEATIGAAHPVTESGEKADDKVTNVVASYARSYAARRGRDVQLAESIVRKSISLTTKEAMKAGLADIEAANLQELIRKLDGRRVDGKTLETTRAKTIPVERTLREKFLHVLADPNIAYILLIIGFYGIIFELSNPGSIFPGVIGAISIVMAFYSLSVLPINAAGIVLMVLALIMFVADIKVPSHGILTIGGIISFLLGSFMLFDASQAVLRASISVIVAATVVTTAFFVFAVGAGLRAQRLKVTTGMEGMVGEIGVARTDLNPKGKVFLEGTLWTAVSDVPVRVGQHVRIRSMQGLVLHVEPEHPDE